MASKDFSVRVGQEEIGRIFNLKENLDLKDLLVAYAPHYQQLGWLLVGMKSPEGSPLELDLSQPVELWSKQFSEMGVDQGQINIGIRTGKASNLLVLEVNKGEGALSLARVENGGPTASPKWAGAGSSTTIACRSRRKLRLLSFWRRRC